MNEKHLSVPATIRNHDGVMYCVPGDREGSDYKWWVELHNDWKFTQGAKAGCAAGGFNSVSDFRYASPIRR